MENGSAHQPSPLALQKLELLDFIDVTDRYERQTAVWRFQYQDLHARWAMERSAAFQDTLDQSYELINETLRHLGGFAVTLEAPSGQRQRVRVGSWHGYDLENPANHLWRPYDPRIVAQYSVNAKALDDIRAELSTGLQ